MHKMYISVARDFSPHPGPRLIRQGKFSGEKFRKVLVAALSTAERVTVDLDGTTGFGSSFLEEAFGGLIRCEGMSREEVERRVIVKSDQDASYKTEVAEAIRDARPEAVALKTNDRAYA